MWDYTALQELDALVNQAVSDGAAPGLAMAIVTPDGEWRTVRGNQQTVPEVIPASPFTLWDLASLSKVVATVPCILQCVEEGSLTLETPIRKILPQFADGSIRILDCLTHTSALPPDIDGYKTMTRAQMLETLWTMQKRPELEGTVTYSDVNFILLGKVIEALHGSLSEYARQTVFQPLDMTDTGYLPGPDRLERCAAYEDLPQRGGMVRGVVHDGKAYRLGGVSGHAGVFSTLEDLCHFARMMIDQGYWKGKRVLSRNALNALRICYTEGKNEKRSLGWVISDSHYLSGEGYSPATLYHTGFSGGSIEIDLDRRLAIVILCNRIHPSRQNQLMLTVRKTLHQKARVCWKEGEES